MRPQDRPIGRRSLLLGLGSCAVAAASPCSGAQGDYPGRPIRLLMPLSAGGPPDVNMRLMATKMKLGQPFVIDNKPGGSGAVAVQLARNAPPDGYTLLMVHAGMLSAQVLLHLYDLTESFQPVTLAGEGQMALVVSARSEARTLDQLLARARARPGSLNYGSVGAGAISHLVSESFNDVARISTEHIPYKGGAEVVQNLIGGQIDFAFVLTQAAVPFIQQGMLRALASLSVQRQAALPDVPTFAELRLPLHPLGSWGGVCVPKGTPSAVVQRLYGEFVAALKDPEVQRQMRMNGTEPVYSASPAAFGQRMQEDLAWARQLVASRNIKAS